MPRERIPLANTNRYRLAMVRKFIQANAQGTSRRAFCLADGIERPTLQTWQRKYDKLVAAVEGEEYRGHRLTLGGSGRIPETFAIEDALLQYVKDLRRGGHVVSQAMIIVAANRLLEGFADNKMEGALSTWCSQFLKRKNLTIRRITYTERQPHPECLVLREEFACEVVKLMERGWATGAVQYGPNRYKS
ncbi:hypothetical protein PHYPSEUDO_001537 [Phytophthora pseudosyringae]|uniref:HTH CENPB-type domain-containing protein n=1 Tax=Phytophthora pseudosyringae TaxID=221518 RepID=A0A8T1VYQ3_9STRA|nr:hypothetical protein PHYPSEUDO_001537 [Phytophthora pseudosyringae]